MMRLRHRRRRWRYRDAYYRRKLRKRLDRRTWYARACVRAAQEAAGDPNAHVIVLPNGDVLVLGEWTHIAKHTKLPS